MSLKMNKAILLDRDGTINVDHGYVYKRAQLDIIPGVTEALKLFQEMDFILIVITNQSGIGRGYYTLKDAEAFNEHLQTELNKYNIKIAHFYICPHSPDEDCTCRKPSPYMVDQAIQEYNIDVKRSYMFGDKESDIVCGERANIQSYMVKNQQSLLYWANELMKGKI